jgi:hypothetical protein
MLECNFEKTTAKTIHQTGCKVNTILGSNYSSPLSRTLMTNDGGNTILHLSLGHCTSMNPSFIRHLSNRYFMPSSKSV